MKTEGTGSFLRSAFGTSDSFAPLDVLKEDPSSSFPKTRFNAVGMRIDLYGEVFTYTKEYAEGWRLFDSHACMYKEDGQGNNQHHNIIGDGSADTLPKPLSCYTWVNPHHLLSPVFGQLNLGQENLVPGRHYLNRMGFVITLEGSPTDAPRAMLRDAHGNLYYTTGRRHGSETSMYDLTHEIIDWEYFIKSEWSEVELVSAGPQPVFDPQNYDPAAISRTELLRRFYDALNEAHSLGKKLDAGFTFSIDTRSKN